MTDRPHLLAESTWRTVDATPYDVAVLPWGATEAHNFHLPYATDTIQCDRVAARAAERAWARGAHVVVLPAVPFGVNTTQLDIKLCINMNPSTQAAVLDDVVRSLDGQGIHKMLILNAHGGNDFRQMIRERQPATRVFLSTINWWSCVDTSRFIEAPGVIAGRLDEPARIDARPPVDRREKYARRRLALADHLPKIVPAVGVENEHFVNALAVQRTHHVVEHRGLRARVHVDAELDVELRRVDAERHCRKHHDVRPTLPRPFGGARRDTIALDRVGRVWQMKVVRFSGAPRQD